MTATALTDEQAARRRHRNLEKARRVRSEKAAALRRSARKEEERFRRWAALEHEYHEAMVRARSAGRGEREHMRWLAHWAQRPPHPAERSVDG